jgi:hypothetical protein
MSIGVIADAEAGAGNQPCEIRELLGMAPHHEKRRWHPLTLQQAYDALGSVWIGSVIEGEIEHRVARPPTDDPPEQRAVGHQRTVRQKRRTPCRRSEQSG